MTPLYCAPAGTRHSPGPHRRIGTRPVIFSTWQSSSGTFARLTLERPTAIVAWTIVIGTAFRVGVAAAGLDFDHSEAHYIASARVLDLSYFDPPPLAFWITWATRTLTGSDSLLAVRAPFIAMFVGTTWMMYRLGAELFDERAGALAALILNLSPLFTISFSAWAQPDGPLTFFVLAAILLVVRLERATATAHRLLLWLGIGACLGLALLSKYPAVLIAAGLLLFAITSAPHRRWFVEPGPYLGAVLALVLFSPVLVWNARHGWISLGFQGGRAFEYEGISLRSLLDSIGGQAVLIGPWIWVPCLQAGVQGLARGPRDWRTWFLATVGATPVVLFTAVALWVSAGGHYHWQAPGYLLLMPLAGHFIAQKLERFDALARHWLLGSTVATVLILTVIVGEAATGWFWTLMPPSFTTDNPDPTLKGTRWKGLVADFDARGLTGKPRLFVATMARTTTGKVDFELGSRVPVICLCADARSLAFTRDPEAYLSWNAVIVIEDGYVPLLQERLGAYFDKIEPLDVVEIRRGDQIAVRLHLYSASNYRKAYPVLPLDP